MFLFPLSKVTYSYLKLDEQSESSQDKLKKQKATGGHLGCTQAMKKSFVWARFTFWVDFLSRSKQACLCPSCMQKLI